MKKSLTIRQYQRLYKLDSIKGLKDGVEKRILTTSIISGIPVKELKAKPLLELTNLIDDTINKYDFDFKEKSKKSTIVVRSLPHNTKYKFWKYL